MAGRILAIGDVHGCDVALTALLDRISVTADDTLVFLGDVVDRGPASKQVVDRLLALQQSCNLVLIMGNHEEMLRDAVAGRPIMDIWLQVGGRETLDSYGGSIDDIPPEHVRFLLSTCPFFETDREIFVHANLEPEVSLANQKSEFLRWTRVTGSEPPHPSGKRVICGHTPQAEGLPLVFDGWAFIDTLPHGGNWLSCLNVATNRVHQASQAGKTREFSLSMDS